MGNTCSKHKTDLTAAGDCAECSAQPPEILPAQDLGKPDEQQTAPDKAPDISNKDDDPIEQEDEEIIVEESTFEISEADQINIIKDVGPIGSVHYHNVSRGLTQNATKQRKIPLFKDSGTIVLKNHDDLGESPLEIIQGFKEQRILLLADSGDRNSYRFSHQIARSLEIKNKEENIRLLSLSNYRENPPNVESFSLERKSSVQDALVIVDATNEVGNFTDSLLNSSVSLLDDYPDKLKTNRLYLICLVNAGSINSWIEKGTVRMFPYWIIPNKKDETRSSQDISESRLDELLNREGDADNQIVRIILFIASFFPNLPTGDFNDLLTGWLRNESEVTMKEPPKNDSDDEVLIKVSLWEVWKSKSRFFTEQCLLSQSKDEQGKRVINFHNNLYAKSIKKRLESHYWAFVDEKISEILDLRLIFHPSDNIASQSITIFTEYLPGNEEKYMDWLLWIFNVLNNEEHAENLRQMLGISEQNTSEETGKKYFYYNRLAKLFRTILWDSSLKSIVSNTMERLIQDKCYQSALTVVKRLQSAPNFDEMHWLRQLLERGDNRTEKEITKYLFNNLINLDINDVFDKLRDWLPRENNSSENYSQANKAALFLLVKYYTYQINIFDEKLYGLEPSQFPLFDFDRKSSAQGRLDLLVKYLLHPANLRLKFDNMPYIYYAAFLLQSWGKILCKNNPSATTLNSDKAISNEQILDVLLEKVVLYSAEAEQERIKGVWDELMNFHDAMFTNHSEWEIREQAIREREFLINLIELFNDKQWASK